MRNSGLRKKERCALCGKPLRKAHVTHDERRKKNLYLFENLPALVCTGCGEVWIEETTLQEVDHLIQKGKPIRNQLTPVFDLKLPRAR